MKNLLIISLLLFSFLRGSSQEVADKTIAFHPSVGKTIDISEKNKYQIFTEYSNETFETAQLVKHVNGTYSIIIMTRSGRSIEKDADISELDNIYAAIDKVTPAATNTTTDRKLSSPEEDKRLEERERNIRRAENTAIAGEIAFRTLWVLLEIIVAVAVSGN